MQDVLLTAFWQARIPFLEAKVHPTVRSRH